jgi:hypothetical protein
MSININILSNFNGSGFDKLSRELDRLNTPMEKLGAVSRTLAPAAQIGLVALGGLAIGAVRAAEEAEVANNRLDSVAKSMGLFGTNTKAVTNRLKDFADETSKKLAVDDELVKSTQAQLLTFKFLGETADETGGAFDRATIAAFDLAAVFGGTGEDNAVRLGKALQDPIAGVTALRRVGVQLSDQQEELIESFVASGDILSAQNIILGEVETQTGGAAEATATGSAKMRVAFEEMAEAIGTGLLPLFEDLVPVVTDFFDYVSKNSGVLTVLAGIFGALAVAILLVNFALNSNPIVLVITAVALLLAGLVLLADYLVNTFAGSWSRFFALVGEWWNSFVYNIGVSINKIGEFFASIFDGLAAIAKGAINGVISVIEGFINKVIGGVNTLLDLINTVLKAGTVIGINFQIPKISSVNIPRLAEGGIVMPRPGGVLANIAEGGQAEAVIPLDRLGDFTGKAGNTYNINVSGGMATGSDIGRAVVNAIKDFERQSGTAWRG